MRLTTYYDKELKEKAFMVKGDEAYAHTTNTVLSIDESSINTSSFNYFTVNGSVDVLRALDSDIDTATVQIYDGDNLLHTIEWSSEMSSSNKNFTLNLNYDTEHIIKAKYSGNKSCLKSTSIVWTHSEDLPPSFATKLTITNNSQLSTGSNSITGKLTYGSSDTAINGATITIYVDGESKGTATTNSSGVYSKSVSLTDGLHEIKVEYGGAVAYSSNKASKSVSVGYDVRIVDYDKIFVDGQGSIYGEVYDWFGTQVSIQSGDVLLKNGSGSSVSGFTETVTDNRVKFTHSSLQLDYTSYKLSYFSLSDTITVSYKLTSNMTLTAPTTDSEVLIAENELLPITINLSVDDAMGYPSSAEGIKVSLTNATDDYVILDSTGSASTYYRGTGVGDVNVTATVGTLSKTLSIKDYVMYATPSVKYNFAYGVIGGTIQELTNGYKFWATSDNWDNVSMYFGDGSSFRDDVSLEFTLAYISNPVKLIFGGYSINNGIVKTTNSLSLKKGDVLKIEIVGTTASFKVNNVLKNSITDVGIKDTMPLIGLYNWIGYTDDMTIDKIKVKRL